MLLSKGFEVEMYTGTPQAEVVGLSDQIVANLDGFVLEPDSRNVEYTTVPLYSYNDLLCALVKPRLRLRSYLKELGDYTLIPGSTLSLNGSDKFLRSDPNNAYHTFIENTYGTKVVTASIHINVGVSHPELLMRLMRLIRVEAPLFLALSASSPFLMGKPTGYHSTRWGLFPKTPTHVPLFESHYHFMKWTEKQLEIGTMKNVRHLWCSIRPNGDKRPYHINRLELRICDLVTSPIELLAITALLEARLFQAMANPEIDPLKMSSLPATTRAEDLLTLTDQNENLAATSSLNAELKHWENGQNIRAKDWINNIYQEVKPLAQEKGLIDFLTPLEKILEHGNTAQKWLRQYEQGMDTRQILINSMDLIAQEEKELEKQLC